MSKNKNRHIQLFLYANVSKSYNVIFSYFVAATSVLMVKVSMNMISLGDQDWHHMK